ncbi:hypothetical protein StoSoilB13_09480 [Arthrobacter sp. StoSoilB13]|nr:hypothetical protein StoSoilB13_09480 [Arthrobacter sp. StoSoilB13]
MCIAGANSTGPVSHEERIGQEVTGLACGCLGQEVRSGRCNDDQVSLVAQTDMVDLLDVVKDAVAHRVSGECLPRGNTDETGGCFGWDHRHLVSGFSKKPEERCNLVGCDPSPDSEDYAHVTSVNRQSVLFCGLDRRGNQEAFVDLAEGDRQ